MASFPVVCPGCLCVYPSPANWCDAIERVMRPEQVKDISRLLSPQVRAGQAAGDVVAKYVRSELATKRLRYIADPAGCDLWGPPAATRMRGGGDCDDLSAFALSVLNAMGTPATMLVGFLCRDGRCEGHAWVEGGDRDGFFQLEATSGVLHRYARPSRYRAHYSLFPGRCLDLRDTEMKHAGQRVVGA